MKDSDLRLDGNAVAGLLGELFRAEMTAALGTCGGCGATSAIGAVHVYAHAPGTVLRCPHCATILMCIVRARGHLLVDMIGLRGVDLSGA